MREKVGFYAILVAVAAVLYWFWAFPYRAALSYREEMQLFLTTSEYFTEHVSDLDGLFIYAGEFLTQFFNNYWIGAAIMTVMMLLPTLFCYPAFRRLAPNASKISLLLIALIPAIGLWLCLGNPEVTMAAVVKTDFIIAIAYLITEAAHHTKRGSRIHVAWRIPAKIAVPVLVAVEAAAVIFLYPKAYDATTYRLIDYDYLVRVNDWDGILELSDEHQPDLPMTVSATNLALGMTGQLDSRAFQYYQHGAEGLVPPFVKETLSSWTTGEIFFQLGMINSAQRFCFEGMEAIPTYNKSARAIKRLSETAIIRGEYTLAKKYLHILENTLFYRKWAQRNLDLIKNPGNMASHPVYGPLRAKMIDDEYLFSEGELDKTFGRLFLRNPGNDLARQYLVVYPLLQRNLDKFRQYMGVVTESRPQYNPLLAQQAVAFMAMKSGQPMPPGMVPPAVEESLRAFARAWTAKDPSLIEPYKRTLFYYLVNEE